jgi:hypothetical protein
LSISLGSSNKLRPSHAISIPLTLHKRVIISFFLTFS